MADPEEGLVPRDEWEDVAPRQRKGIRLFCIYLLSAFSDEYSSILVFLYSLCVNFDALIVASVSAASPCLFYYYRPGGKMLAYNLSWTFFTVAVIFPLTVTMTATFARRESALAQLCILKANMLSIYLAHRDWDWWTLAAAPSEPSTSGREQRLSTSHVGRVFTAITGVMDSLKVALTAPIVSRTKHFHTHEGRSQRSVVVQRIRAVHARMATHLAQLSLLCEELKAAGLPANEAARIRQYNTCAMGALLQLRAIKQYRTPLGLRAFSRVFILITPMMFGPYYAQLALSTSIAFAIVLSVLMTMALQGLFNLRYELEDPFSPDCRDAVDLVKELGELEDDLRTFNTPPSAGCMAL